MTEYFNLGSTEKWVLVFLHQNFQIPLFSAFRIAWGTYTWGFFPSKKKKKKSFC